MVICGKNESLICSGSKRTGFVLKGKNRTFNISMFRNTKIQLLLLAFVAICIYACVKQENLPSTPYITYKNFVWNQVDTAIMQITFQDGDGDVGHEQGDTAHPFGANDPYYNDLVMVYYFKDVDGVFRRYHVPGTAATDSLITGYHIPYITPKGKNKTLTGTIDVNMVVPFWRVDAYSPKHTIIRFDIYIYDRALHKSNVITTPEIKVAP